MPRACSIKTFLLSVTLSIFLFLPLLCNKALSAEYAHASENTSAVHEDAQGSEEAGNETDRSADLRDLFYRFMTFLLVVILLVVVAKKARLTDYLSARSDDIQKRLEDLQREKEEAEKKCRDMEERLDDFESKREKILGEYRKEGIAERERIIDEARERVRQILEQSQISIDQEIRSARNRLKQDITETAMVQAREIIKREITEKDNDGLINEFIERVRGTN